jgi:hypothetical protein
MSDQIQQLTRRLFMALTGAAAAGAAVPGLGGLAEGAPAMSEVDKKNIDAVLGMSAAFKTRDANKIAPFFHEQVAFRGGADNMEAPPTVGKAKVVASLASFLKTTSIEMHVLDAYALNPVVVTVHQQLFENAERGPHEDLYIGCFFMQDGTIREWNDYAIIRYGQPRATGTAARGRFIHVGGETAKP